MLKHIISFIVILSFAPRLHSQVVLSEVMFDAFGSEFHDEFIEIVNLSDAEIFDLTGWKISDGSGVDTFVEVDGGFILQPGQFAIILDASYFENSTAYDDLIPAESLILTIDNNTLGSSGLSNSTAETISLTDSSGMIVSQYTYSLGNNPGFSDEKVDLFGPNTSDNWADSRVRLGTPGAPNSVSPRNFDLAIFPDDIRFSPETLIAGESVLMTATVHNLGAAPAANFSATFFEDSNEDLIPDAGEELAPPFEFSGNLAPTDSTAFLLEYMGIPAGSHRIFVQIDFAADEDTMNNVADKELLVGVSPNTVAINEMMYSPLSDQSEWIEIANISSRPVNLNQWSMSDANVERRAFIETEAMVLPGAYFVLAKDSTLLNLFNPPPGSFTFLKDLPSLNNDFDSVILYDFAGNVIDRVDYDDSWGGDTGFSLERINPELASNDSANWSTSVAAPGGTPGEQNSIFADVLPSEATLSISPNPFSPDGDGHEDFAIINYDLPVITAAVNLKIYDLRGRLIRFLANNQSSGSQNAIIWDGKDDRNQVARMGIYIVFLQALNAEAGVIKTQKKSVVLAGKL